MLTSKIYSIFLSICGCVIVAGTGVACPKINGLIDYNCDQVCKISVTGDSIVKGVGDIVEYVNGGDDIVGGGYVNRIATTFPKCQISNLGIPGITTERLIRAFKNRLQAEGNNITKQKTYGSDYFIVDVGRNDFFEEDSNPSRTANNIRRLIKYIKSKYQQNGMDAPFFIVPKLLKSTRTFQEPFIEKVNQAISFLSLPAGPDLSQLQPLFTISEDGIHPNSHGYDTVARYIARYIKKEAQAAVKPKFTDRDKDKVYDKYELKKFFTDPRKLDTDGDGISDGDEIFVVKSNPLDPASFLPPVTISPAATATPTQTAEPAATETSTPTPTPTPTATP